MDGTLGFVFEDWLDIETFTDHSKDIFEFSLDSGSTLVVKQDKFKHTDKVDDTGAVVWDDAVMLAKYLELRVDLKGKTVVELGAGTGFLGMVAASLGAVQVCVTDQKCRLEQIQNNVRSNSLHCCIVRELDWRSPATMDDPFDVILIRYLPFLLLLLICLFVVDAYITNML